VGDREGGEMKNRGGFMKVRWLAGMAVVFGLLAFGQARAAGVIADGQVVYVSDTCNHSDFANSLAALSTNLCDAAHFYGNTWNPVCPVVQQLSSPNNALPYMVTVGCDQLVYLGHKVNGYHHHTGTVPFAKVSTFAPGVNLATIMSIYTIEMLLNPQNAADQYEVCPGTQSPSTYNIGTEPVCNFELRPTTSWPGTDTCLDYPGNPCAGH
jgi:hypothetical protein